MIIFLPDNFDIFGVPETYYRDSNEIPDLVFDAREGPFSDQIAQIYKLICLKRLEETEKMRSNLVREIGDDQYSEIKRIDHFLKRVK